MVVIKDPANEPEAIITRAYIDALNKDPLNLTSGLHDFAERVRYWGPIYLTEEGVQKLNEYPGIDGLAEDPGLKFL